MEKERKNKNYKVRKKRKKYKLRFYFIIFTFIVMLLILVKKLITNKKNINKIYTDSEYNSLIIQENDNIYYEKAKKQNYKYVKISENEWKIKSKKSDKNDYLFFKDINSYLEKIKKMQDDISIAVSDEKGNMIFAINENLEFSEYKFNKILEMATLYRLADEKKINFNDNIKIIKEDTNQSYFFDINDVGKNYSIRNLLSRYENNDDKTALSIIYRYLTSKNINIKYEKNKMLNKNEDTAITIKDTLNLYRKMMEKHSVYNNIIKPSKNEDEKLFLNSIYTAKGNYNIHNITEDYMYDIGFVNSENKYYYAIFSKELKQEDIQIIGDLINRNIEYFYSLKKI